MLYFPSKDLNEINEINIAFNYHVKGDDE